MIEPLAYGLHTTSNRVLKGSRNQMELLYHVGEDDSVLGSIERDQAHAKGIMHRSGIVFVIRPDRRILLQRRSPLKEIFPDCYDCSCAFHVTFGESYEEAAKRELWEETGISARIDYVGKFSHHDPPEHQTVAVFKCYTNERIELDENEAVGADYLTRDDVDEIVLRRRVTPWLRDGWKLARDKIL